MSKKEIDKAKISEALIKTARSLWNSSPILLGVILLVSLANTLLPKSVFSSLFKNSPILDPLIGSSLGSVLAGNPITSYIVSGELLKQGVSLVAVTSFIVAWVTVGIVQLPAESLLLGKKFAIVRNITSFIFSIVVAIITVAMVNLL